MSNTKKIIIIVASIFVVTIGSLTAYNIINFNMTETIRKDAGELNGRIDFEGPSTIGEIKTESTDEEIDLVMKHVLNKRIEVKNEDVIYLMHAMTHQKVVSDSKETSVQMTTERIEQLTTVIEGKGKAWDNYGKLMSIVTKWQNQDFSEIDKDHNYLWGLEKGNHGKAMGISSPKEEAYFIKDKWGEPSIQE
ncbi:DUF6241 domain-containing protein [Paenibacillus gallinarum]|uniref:PRK06770 family protein n=1 Tax=Paenibacillus gallinarum TaxID=2762232 RepID=A0ABR8T056_9BACL|nr:DUF6241 domain-containing protein [Paenibacillus gallinarum]MBD7969126.1 hypothetical protein [Paenibacillus gallinarum]